MAASVIELDRFERAGRLGELSREADVARPFENGWNLREALRMDHRVFSSNQHAIDKFRLGQTFRSRSNCRG